LKQPDNLATRILIVESFGHSSVMKRQASNLDNEKFKKPRLMSSSLDELDESLCLLIMSYCSFYTISQCSLISRRFNRAIISPKFVQKLYHDNTGTPKCILEKTSKSSALSLQQLHWVQYLGLTHHKDFELILNPLGTSTVEEIYPSLFCSLDMMDDVWVISGSLPAEHVDVYSKYPVVVRDVHSLDIVGYIAFQRCFASSIVTSKVKGKFLVTAWDRYVYSTHIANNLCYREDLHGIFITDVKKKLLYTHPTPISNFSVSDGAYFVINDERCVYLAALQEHILEFKSKSKLSELRKYDPISSDELGMSSFDPALGVLWCCTKSGKIFIWYEVSDPLKFEVIDLHWNLAREHPTLIKCDAAMKMDAYSSSPTTTVNISC
jgi:hypothetical protein